MWTILSLLANVLFIILFTVLFIAFRLRRRRWQYAEHGKWPIAKAALGDIDPIFRLGSLGPRRETGIYSFSSYHVIGGVSDFETWVMCNLAKKAVAIFEFGTCTGKTTWLLATNAPQATITTLTLKPENLNTYKAGDGDDEEARQWAVEGIAVMKR